MGNTDEYSSEDDLSSSENNDTEPISTKPCRYHDYSRVPPEQIETLDQSTATPKEPTFPMKLHMILANTEFQDIVTWLPHGRAWRILQQKTFEERVIPLYFRHGRYSSFARQVNGWGFRRITHGSDYNSYYHERFLRGKVHLCEKMRRLNAKHLAKFREEQGPAPDFYKLSRDNPLPEATPITTTTEESVEDVAEKVENTENEESDDVSPAEVTSSSSNITRRSSVQETRLSSSVKNDTPQVVHGTTAARSSLNPVLAAAPAQFQPAHVSSGVPVTSASGAPGSAVAPSASNTGSATEISNAQTTTVLATAALPSSLTALPQNSALAAQIRSAVPGQAIAIVVPTSEQGSAGQFSNLGATAHPPSLGTIAPVTTTGIGAGTLSAAIPSLRAAPAPDVGSTAQSSAFVTSEIGSSSSTIPDSSSDLTTILDYTRSALRAASAVLGQSCGALGSTPVSTVPRTTTSNVAPFASSSMLPSRATLVPANTTVIGTRNPGGTMVANAIGTTAASIIPTNTIGTSGNVIAANTIGTTGTNVFPVSTIRAARTIVPANTLGGTGSLAPAALGMTNVVPTAEVNTLALPPGTNLGTATMNQGINLSTSTLGTTAPPTTTIITLSPVTNSASESFFATANPGTLASIQASNLNPSTYTTGATVDTTVFPPASYQGRIAVMDPSTTTVIGATTLQHPPVGGTVINLGQLFDGSANIAQFQGQPGS